ncbi:phosphoribosylglycinamide synthetase C domain-containing protein [Variovorax sp. ZT4R33]|uniref:phosphoribosylglycinamide synthetase C domain-containing protein n=1 Tax=Variovorax sp. ZT4R33 TaxID=3443743 RepID=UPI003F44732C
MRFLGIGETCDLGDMYWRLMQAGHEVRVYIEDGQAHDVFGGMLTRVEDWRQALDWIREVGSGGIVLFESAVKGDWQDALRQDGFQVIGGSAYGDRLEDERAFGQSELRHAGLRTARSHSFTDIQAALDFLAHAPGRYVFKNNGANAERTRNYVGELDSAADMVAFLQLQQAHLRSRPEPVSFVLMEYVHGVEIGVGAYFNGREFLGPALLDWEHKRFFPGDLGELTGEMGTIVSYRGAQPLFERTLACMAEPLRAAGHCGYINLNLIVNEHGLWPLEFTSRFGYPGYAICDALHLEPWDSIFRKMLSGEPARIATRPGFACGVVLTVPPFPYAHGYAEISKGSPICFRETVTAAERDAVHFAEVALQEDHLVASGSTGYIGVATGIGADIPAAQRAAYDAARQVVVPNLRYRTDIGTRVHQAELDLLSRWGLLDGAAGPEAP